MKKAPRIISLLSFVIIFLFVRCSKYAFLVSKGKILYKEKGIMIYGWDRTFFFPAKSLSDSTLDYSQNLTTENIGRGFLIDFPLIDEHYQFFKYFQNVEIKDGTCIHIIETPKNNMRILPVEIEYTKRDIFKEMGFQTHLSILRDTLVINQKKIVLTVFNKMYDVKTINRFIDSRIENHLDSIWKNKGYPEPRPSDMPH
ncbi:MAG: hypothetical protein NTX03_03345 [Bacteroidetes bacterium]|nr:hypothetical protein [Bacteroidota bacterium]